MNVEWNQAAELWASKIWPGKCMEVRGKGAGGDRGTGVRWPQGFHQQGARTPPDGGSEKLGNDGCPL